MEEKMFNENDVYFETMELYFREFMGKLLEHSDLINLSDDEIIMNAKIMRFFLDTVEYIKRSQEQIDRIEKKINVIDRKILSMINR